jgi:tripeptide aminopeptidase
MNIDKEDLVSRFMKYVAIDTQSDPKSEYSPSTEKQKDLSRILHQELQDLGIDAEIDEFGQVYAFLPSNTGKNVPTIAFFAHVDTAPDCSGTNVKPIRHRNYDGKPIILPDDPAQILNVENSPFLKDHIGKDIITASGLTLLGADDKADVAALMSAMLYLKQNPQIRHGDIRAVFTIDEEVGGSTKKLDLNKINAHFGYTVDSGEAGSLEYNCFNADSAIIEIEGILAHTGYAKGKMVHAVKVAAAIITASSQDGWSPETTEKLEGFVHLTRLEGGQEKSAKLFYMIRDFTLDGLNKSYERLESIANKTAKEFPGARVSITRKEQYRNMYEVIKDYPECISFADEAIKRAGLAVIINHIRGGTDGSKLSFMGLPCPNIFNGMQNVHSQIEWVGVEDLLKSAETIVHLAMVWEEKGEGVKTPPKPV